MNVTDFLLARIADDEAEAKNLQGEIDFGLEACGDRMLAECAAKRAIIAAFDPKAPDLDPYVGVSVLAMLAAVYKDHPDYQQEWAPTHS